MTKNTAKEGHFLAAYDLKTNEQTKAYYRSWAKTYDREVGEENSYAQPARVAEMLKRFILNQKAKILDAGCGSGLSGQALKDAGYQHLQGCDFSPEMLEIARQKNCYEDLFHADLNNGQPNISDDTYDAIVCVGVFSFGHVLPDACDDLLRLLRPGGILIIALNEHYWDKGDLKEKIQTFVAEGKAQILAQEFGDHLPGHDVKGWVIALKKCWT